MSDLKLTAYQKKKILRVFTTFFDINNDGVIEWKDFELAIDKICTIHGWPVGGDHHTSAMDTLRLMWDGLKTYADRNKDNKITKEEWLLMWEECMQATTDRRELPEWQHRYMDFMFDANDTSGDKLIDKGEYVTVYTSFGLTRVDCETAFDKFALRGVIDRNEFSELWTEYFLSSDPSLKGNYLFGLPNF